MVTGRNPWKSATKEDTVYQSYLNCPSNFFSSVLPVSVPFNNLLVKVLNPDWDARIGLEEFRTLLQNIPTFYSVNVHFEGNLARYCWEAGIKAREDLVDGTHGPVVKRPVPPPPPPRSRKPVTPIHEETRARPIETPQPPKRKRLPPPPAPKARIIKRPTMSPRPTFRDSMDSIMLDGEGEGQRPSSIEVTRTSSSQGTSSPSSSFPKTPTSSPHRLNRRPRVATDLHLSPSYSPQLDDPLAFYGLEFCKRLIAVPSDADSDATDASMISPSSSQYSLHERECLGCTNSLGRQSDGTGSTGSDIILYPDMATPERSKPIDIVRPRHDSSSRRHRRHPSAYHHPHLASVHMNSGFRHRRPMAPELPPRPGGRVTELRKRYEGSSPAPLPGHAHEAQSHYGRQAAYASGNAHWYH